MKCIGRKFIFSVFFLLFVFINSAHANTTELQNALSDNFDIVVYGGTSAGIAASVQAARMGRTVVMIEPTRHIGGMSSSGLGRSDVGNVSTIGGLPLEFSQRVFWNYRWGTRINPGMWKFEPHGAEYIFNQMIDEAGVNVIYGERLDLENGVMRDGNKITAIKMESGLVVSGLMFIDCSYEGDLMALAGVDYTIGRESNETYGETLNGIQTGHARHHNFILDVDPYIIPGDPSSGLLPGISPSPPAPDGSADPGIQAYNFRMCLTDDPENRVPWVEPENYDPLQYELLLRYFDAGFTEVPLHIYSGIAHNKSDTNNNHAFSTDYIGMNYEWPDGNYETRDRIYRDHENYQRGLMWTLASNPRVPENVRDTLAQWGLAADEFTDNDNWPWQLYVREARRMISDYVMTENNCLGHVSAVDPVGMGSYNMDSHNVQRYADENGFVRNEGDVQVGSVPYTISYRSIIPSIGQCENLIVPVCLSASHIAYGSIRMEPVFMILGQSAATAAVIAIDTNTSVQDLFYPILREVLTNEGQILSQTIDPFDLEGIVIDDSQAVKTGEWIDSTSVFPYVGGGYVHDDNTGAGKELRFDAEILRDGTCEVRFYFTRHENRASNVGITISHADGTSVRTLDETPSLAHSLQGYIAFGEFRFTRQSGVSVVISNEGADGYVVADAIQLVRIN